MLSAFLCSEWSNLVGVPVQLHRHGKYIRSGVIDAAMPDSSLLWLAADGADERQMFEAALGYQAWICPEELTGDLRFKMAKNTLDAVDENAAAMSSVLPQRSRGRDTSRAMEWVA